MPDSRSKRAPKKRQIGPVIILARTSPKLITVLNIRDLSQLTLLRAISAFGDLTPTLIITKGNIFQKNLLTSHERRDLASIRSNRRAKQILILRTSGTADKSLPADELFKRTPLVTSCRSIIQAQSKWPREMSHSSDGTVVGKHRMIATFIKLPRFL
jgi:hypothetical protein